MKIAIVDDNKEALAALMNALRGDGHEVLAVLVSPRDADQGMVGVPSNPSTGVAKTVAHLREFNPDQVLLDHDLRLGGCDMGDQVAAQSSIPREKLIGTSTAWPQSYCARIYEAKEVLEKGNQAAKAELLALFK